MRGWDIVVKFILKNFVVRFELIRYRRMWRSDELLWTNEYNKHQRFNCAIHINSLPKLINSRLHTREIKIIRDYSPLSYIQLYLKHFLNSWSYFWWYMLGWKGLYNSISCPAFQARDLLFPYLLSTS
jgi:hypothetical protein